MRRVLALLTPLLLAQCLDGSTEGSATPVAAQAISIASRPVLLDAGNHLRNRLGPLRFVGGWQLTSSARAFGGLSALDVNGQNVTAVSDIGAIVRFRIGRFGTVSNARIDPIPAGCGNVTEKFDTDSESLAHDATRAQWWIGFEWRNVICRVSSDLATGERVTAPRTMAGWPRKYGPETLVQLNDGRFLAIEEGQPGTATPRRVLIFNGDPADPATPVALLSYAPPVGFNPTDGAQLPDGRLLILNRRFALASLFTAKLVIINPAAMQPGSTMTGRVIATFESPVITDNFEGLSVTVENGQPMLWIVSDDNYMRWQRTLLLKFALN